jgi:hypothetical protein
MRTFLLTLLLCCFGGLPAALASSPALEWVETSASHLEWEGKQRPTLRCQAFDSKERPLPRAVTWWQFSQPDNKRTLLRNTWPSLPGEWEVRCVASYKKKIVRDNTPLSVILHPPTPASLRLSWKQKKRWWRSGTLLPLKAQLRDRQGRLLPFRRWQWQTTPTSALFDSSLKAPSLRHHGLVQLRLLVPRRGNTPLVQSVQVQLDSRPPEISVTSPEEGAQLKADSTFVLRGQVKDQGSGLQGLWWKGWPVPLKANGSFEIRQRCVRGKSLRLSLLARDKAGHMTVFRRTVYCQKTDEIPWKTRRWQLNNAIVLRLHQRWLDHPKRTDDLASVLEKALSETNLNKLHPRPLARGIARLPFFGKTRFVVRRRGDISIGRWKVTLKTYHGWLLARVELSNLQIPLSIRLGFAQQKPLLKASSMFFTLKLKLDNQKQPTKAVVQSFQIDLSKLKILQLTSGVRLLEKTFAKTLRDTARREMAKALQEQIPTLFTQTLKRWLFRKVLALPSRQAVSPRLETGLKLQKVESHPEGLVVVASVLMGRPDSTPRPASKPSGTSATQKTKAVVVNLTPPQRRWNNASFDILVSRRLLNLSMRTLWQTRWLEKEWNHFLQQQKQWMPGNTPFPELLRQFQVSIRPLLPPFWKAGSSASSLRLQWNSLEVTLTLPLPTGVVVTQRFRLHLDAEATLRFAKGYKKARLHTRLVDFRLESPGNQHPLPQQLSQVLTSFVWDAVPRYLQPLLQKSINTIVPLSPWLKNVPLKLPALHLQPAGMDLQSEFLLLSWNLLPDTTSK